MVLGRARRLALLTLSSTIFLGVSACCFGCPSLDPANVCVPIGTNGQKPPSSKTPFIWIGTDDANGDYRPIVPNETLPIQFGSQGGQHVWGAAHLYAPGSSATWKLTFQIKGNDGSEIAAFEDLLEACDTDLASASKVTVRFQSFTTTTTPASGTLMVDATPDGGKTTVHAEVPISWK